MKQRSFALGWSAQVLARTLSVLASLLSLAVLSRRLGDEAFGSWSVVVAWTTLIAPIADLGLATVLVRDEEQRTVRRTIGTAVGLQTLLVGCGGALLTGVGAVLLPGPAGSEASLLLAASSLVPSAAYLLLQVPLVQEERFVEMALVDLLARIITAAATIAAVETGVRAPWLFLVLSLPPALGILGLLVLDPRGWQALRPRFDTTALASLLKRSLPVAASLALFAIYLRLDAVLLARLSDLPTVGRYGLAYRVTEFVLSIPGIFVAVAFPRLVAHKADVAVLATQIGRCLDVLVLAAMPVVLVALVGGSWIMSSLGGQDYAAGGKTLSLLLLSAAASFITALWGQVLVVVDSAGLLFWFSLVNVLLNVALNLVLIPSLGSEGAAASTLCTELVAVIGVGGLLRHRGLARVPLRTCLSAGAALLGGVAVATLVDRSLSVPMALAAGLLTLALLAAILRPPALQRGSLLRAAHA